EPRPLDGGRDVSVRPGGQGRNRILPAVAGQVVRQVGQEAGEGRLGDDRIEKDRCGRHQTRLPSGVFARSVVACPTDRANTAAATATTSMICIQPWLLSLPVPRPWMTAMGKQA